MTCRPAVAICHEPFAAVLVTLVEEPIGVAVSTEKFCPSAEPSNIKVADHVPEMVTPAPPTAGVIFRNTHAVDVQVAAVAVIVPNLAIWAGASRASTIRKNATHSICFIFPYKNISTPNRL